MLAKQKPTETRTREGMRSVAETLASLLPLSAWVFGRVSRRGGMSDAYVGATAHERERLLEILHDEAGRVREGRVPLAVSRTQVPVEPYGHGVTLKLGSEDRSAVILILLRFTQPFEESELELLANALSTGYDFLLGFRTFHDDAAPQERVKQRALSDFYVLDSDYTIEYYFEQKAAAEGSEPTMFDQSKKRFPAVIENTVRELTKGWNDDPALRRPATAMPFQFLIVRVVPLCGSSELRFGVSLQHFQVRNATKWAMQRFQLSRREMQILRLISVGQGTPEIAHALHIAESTAHEHIKRMLAKTNSRNRAEMVARALGADRKEPR